jgi:hypothetical protein
VELGRLRPPGVRQAALRQALAADVLGDEGVAVDVGHDYKLGGCGDGNRGECVRAVIDHTAATNGTGTAAAIAAAGTAA